MTDQSVLCIGLDAACFEQLDPLVNAGAMPNLQQLLVTGNSSSLEATTPPWTPSAWPSITTGTTPWRHGIYDFYDYTTDEPHLVGATDLQMPYLWEYLDAAGIGSIVVNVPVTHPVHEMQGSLIPGYLAPEGSLALVNGEPKAPSTLVTDYRIYAEKVNGREAKLSQEEALIDSRVTAAERLAASQDWSFMMVQFQRTDAIFHTMGHDSSAVRRVYERIDHAIGSLLELVDEKTTVIVVSDHGIHEYDHTFHCNTFLRDAGWLQTSTESERYSWGDATKPTGDRTDNTPAASHRVLSTGIDVLQQIGITPQRAEKMLSIVGLAEAIRRRLPAEMLLDAAEHVDWAESHVYCRSLSSLGVRCNVAGRDPNGIINKKQFENVRSELLDTLRDIRGPDGAPVFEEVYDRHERHGSDVANERSAPDIVLRPKNMEWKIMDVTREPVFERMNEYNHKYEGLFVATGPRINSDSDIAPSAVDVAPTILELLGYRTPAMEGTVPDGLLATDGKSSVTVSNLDERSYVTEERSEHTETVTDRLEQLGYLE